VRDGSPLDLIERSGSALLEGWSDSGRWTVILPEPAEEFKVSWGDEERLEGFLRECLSQVRPADVPAEIPFAGGWVGFLSYELGASWEGAAPREERPAEPAALFYRHDGGIAISPKGETVQFGDQASLPAGARSGATSHFSPGRAVRRDLAEAKNRRGAADKGAIVSVAAPFATDEHQGARSVEPPRAGPNVGDSLGEESYVRAHEAIRQGIARGDYYQVNLTRRFRAAVSRQPDPRNLFTALAGEVAPPYSALIRGGGFDILSVSPELFLRADFVSREVEMRPIKGTAPRFADPVRDRASAEALIHSTKDRAENVMIVDLCRNDLGKVCEPGSVRVSGLCGLASHRVHHLESMIRGRLKKDASPADLLRATFPPGSVTGAPKRAAVSAIRDLEPVPRGVYTGAIGFLDCRGRLAFNVAIRTAISTDREVRYHAGGGIVWDSVAEKEREEGNLKAQEFFSLLGEQREDVSA
jgi:para-aminobenzoate synthetase component 1